MNTPNFIKFSIFAFGVLGFAFISSCKKDSAEARYIRETADGCDTANITFAAVISPKLNAECASCHAWANQSDPSSYFQVKDMASTILSRVNKNPSEPQFMPQGGQKWTPCEIKEFKHWMNTGFRP